MRIRIADMPADGMRLADSLEVAQLPELVRLTRQGTCRFQIPVDVTLHIARVADIYPVEGKLRTTVGLTCSRCLDAFEDTLASQFHVTYTRESAAGEGAATAEARELTAEEMGLVPFEGDEIDFRNTLQEQIILALPMQPRCRHDCRGLCAQCGTNLNQTSCNCRSETVDPRLAILKQLKLKD